MFELSDFDSIADYRQFSNQPHVHTSIAVYVCVLYMKRNVEKGLETATSCKKEFTQGDAMELKGKEFMKNKLVKIWINTLNCFQIRVQYTSQINHKINCLMNCCKCWNQKIFCCQQEHKNN